MLKLPKKHLEVFFYSLKGTEGVLNLAESRLRDKFMKPLGEATDLYIKDRTKIYETFCLKKEDGSIDFLVNGETTSYQFPPEKLEEINSELITLADEEVELEASDKIKEFIEKSEYKPKVGESEIIDAVIAKF